MPCRPVEDDPGRTPKSGALAAQLLIWVCEQLDREPPIWCHDLAADPHSTDSRPTIALCRLMRELPDAKRNALTRTNAGWMHWELAHWWMRHEQADAARQSRDKGKGRER